MSKQDQVRKRQDKTGSSEAQEWRNARVMQLQNRSLKRCRTKKLFPCEPCAAFDGVAQLTSRQLMAAWVEAFLPDWERCIVTLQFQHSVTNELASKAISLAANMRDQRLLGKSKQLKPSKATSRSFEILFPETGLGCNDQVQHFHGLIMVPPCYDTAKVFVPVAVECYLEAMAKVMQNPMVAGHFGVVLRQLQAKQSHKSGKPVLIERCRDVHAARIYAMKRFIEGKSPIETVHSIPAAQRKMLPQVTDEQFAELLHRSTGLWTGPSQEAPPGGVFIPASAA
jgi:hypothetical protein